MSIPIKKISLAVLGLLVAAALVEGVLQLTDPTTYDRFAQDAESGLVHYKQNSSFVQANLCLRNHVEINSLGFHAPEPPTQVKPKDEFRVVLVGSSFAEGLTVQIPQMLSSQLEQKLQALPRGDTYRVIPVAFSGNGTYLDILYYLRYGRPLHPDLVIDLTTEYEVGRNTSGAPFQPKYDTSNNLVRSLPKKPPMGRIAALKDVLRHSKLAMNVYNRFLLLRNRSPEQEIGADETTHTFSAEEELKREWQEERKLMSQFAKIAQEDNAHFLVASWAIPDTATSSIDLLHTNLTESAAENEFSYLDLIPSISLQEQRYGERASWPCDGHWSDRGNAFAAQALFDYLMAHKELLKKT